MLWIIFAVGAAVAWGLYGPVLHQGQVDLKNPMRALLCVGVAYFLVGVIVPVISLSSQGQLGGFTTKGALLAGAGGALGDGTRIQFRVEAFNLFNRANFGNPSLIAFTGAADNERPLPTFGRIRSTVTSARQVQLGVRLSF